MRHFLELIIFSKKLMFTKVKILTTLTKWRRVTTNYTVKNNSSFEDRKKFWTSLIKRWPPLQGFYEGLFLLFFLLLLNVEVWRKKKLNPPSPLWKIFIFFKWRLSWRRTILWKRTNEITLLPCKRRIVEKYTFKRIHTILLFPAVLTHQCNCCPC